MGDKTNSTDLHSNLVGNFIYLKLCKHLDIGVLYFTYYLFLERE